MKKFLLKEPLIHFLLLSLGLFGLYGIVGDKLGGTDSKKIVVDKAAIQTFIQYRSKSFDEKSSQEKLDALSKEELDLLIKDLVREEALYREAESIGLSDNDYVIRRRLIQKLEFISRAFHDANARLSKEDVATYFDANKNDYYAQPYVTFTHVFFDNERHGEGKAKTLAMAKITKLNKQKVSFSNAISHGDRFLYHVNYVERTPDYITSHFGVEMAKSVFDLNANEKKWHGPYESPYGSHLVMVSKKAEGRFPELNEIVDLVQLDAREAFIKNKANEAIDGIIEGYDVDIVYKKDNSSSSRPAPAGKLRPGSRS